MNKLSLDFYNCNNTFMKGDLKNAFTVYEACSHFEKLLNIKFLYKPLIIPYFYGKNPKDDGVSSLCIFKDDKDRLGFFSLHTFNKRNLAYFDMISQSKINFTKIEKNLASMFCPKNIKYPEPLKQGSWGIELVAECFNKNINFNIMNELCNAIIKKINMTQIANTMIENNERYSLLCTLIAESHIAIIYDKKSSKLFIDMFSCKYYDYKIVSALFNDFNLTINKIQVGSRGLLHDKF